MAIIDNPLTGGGGGGSAVTEETALQYMLNNKTTYTGIAAGLTGLTEFPSFTQPANLGGNFNSMCEGCTSLTVAPSISSTVSGCFCDNTFRDCSSMTDASQFQITGAQYLSRTFYGCTSLTVTPDLTNVSGNGLQNHETGSAFMFQGCTSLVAVDIPASTTSIFYYTPTMQQMFYNCSSFTTFNQTNTLKTRYCARFRQAFAGTKIQSIILSLASPTGSVPYNAGITDTNTTEMFSGCNNLTSVSVTGDGVKYVKNATSMFYQCTGLSTISATFSAVVTGTSMFNGCSSLVSLSSVGFGSSLETCGQMFRGCSALTTLPNINLSSATAADSLRNMFTGCSSLNSTSLNKILASLATWGGSSNKTLKYIGLTSAQATTCTGLSNWAALSAAGWTTGY